MPKVLVADDSITVRKVAERLLTEAGMEVALAANGEEALAWLANEQPDFIISDVIMPDKSGYDVCRYVRSQAALSETPVLLISGIVSEEVNRQAESCRADGVLKKPFQGSSLQERVRELLAKKAEKPTTSAVNEHDSAAEAAIHDASQPARAAPGNQTNPKAYRITEEQLQSFRQAASRIKELEGLLADEKTRSASLNEQIEAARQIESRIRELEASLVEQQKRAADLEQQGSRLAEMERRNKELEALLLKSQSPSLPISEPSSVANGGESPEELHALLAEQQQRLVELSNQVMKSNEAESRIKMLEDSLKNEQGRAEELAQRCVDLERAASRANARLDEVTARLAQIARLATKPEEPEMRFPPQ
ncbi:MAG: hypothetical protein C4293_02245 [Nitrospiraceae bacterium]